MEGDRLAGVKERLCSYYTEEEGGLKSYVLRTRVQARDDENRIQVLSVGEGGDRVGGDRPAKCVLLLGESGAGKTTLVNAIVNHVFGVVFEDDFRLVIRDQKVDDGRRDTESQTDYITVYLILHDEDMVWPNSLVLIDTPGLADTRGDTQQRSVMAHLECFLTSDYGVDELHCIGLVAKANTNRDFTFQRDILAEIISLLGNNVPDITHLFATFAVEKPMVDQIMRNAGVKFNEMFEFDNGVMLAANNVDLKRERAMLAFRWEIMTEQYQNFLDRLAQTPPLSVKLLREKKLKDTSARCVKKHVEDLGRLVSAMEESRKMLVKYELQEAKNKNFRQEVRRHRKQRVKVDKGFHAHNCPECDQTCIFPCPPDHDRNNAGLIGSVAGVLGGSAAGAVAAQSTMTAVTAARAAVTSGYAAAIGGWVTRALGGAVAGGEVGAAGGVPGVLVGGMIGITVGAMAGACCGKMLTSSSCATPGRGDVCGERGCLHALSQHVLEDERIMEFDTNEIQIDDYAKELHDVAVSKRTDAMAKIVSGGQKIIQCKKSVSHHVLKMLFHIRNVLELTDGSDVIDPIDILDGLIAEVRLGQPDTIHHAINVLQILKRAVKTIEFSSAEEVCDKTDVVMHMLENVP